VLAYVPANRVVVLTIPDFTLTEAGGAADDAEEVSARIEELNGLLLDVATQRGVAVVDISPIADRVTFDRTLVAEDGSHPSAKQYAGWADLVAMTVRQLFRVTPPRWCRAPPNHRDHHLAAIPDAASPSDPIPSPVLITS